MLSMVAASAWWLTKMVTPATTPIDQERLEAIREKIYEEFSRGDDNLDDEYDDQDE